MADDSIKEAEKRGYAKGYAAGQRRKKAAATAAAQQRKHDAAWNRAFLAALPQAMVIQDWTRGDKPIRSIEERVRLAGSFASEAVKLMRIV